MIFKRLFSISLVSILFEFVDEQLKTAAWWFLLPGGLSRGAAGRPSVDTADPAWRAAEPSDQSATLGGTAVNLAK